MLRSVGLSCLSGLFLALPFINGALWAFAWFGFVPVFFALNGKSSKNAAFLFFITGITFWSAVIYWLAHVTVPGTIILIVYLALYFAVFGLIIRPATRHSAPYVLVFIPSVWVLLEYARGSLLTGFPWALLGYSQYRNLVIIQIADIAGVFGVSYLVMLVNVALVEMAWSARTGQTARFKTTAGILFLFLLSAAAYGYFGLSRYAASASPRSMRISVIQGNIPQQMKWDERTQDFIMDKYIAVTKSASARRPDLIIWPEAALPVVAEEEPVYLERVRNSAREIQTPLLLGAVTMRRGSYYNSCLLISKDGSDLGRYDKLHLVPFGEYIPLRSVLPFLETVVPIGDVTRGKEYTVFDLSGARFSALICFEDLFPGLSRDFVRGGAAFLVNITNDAWYKKTSAAFQHFQASVFRAVENRVWLVRAANTGVSGFIAPSGRAASLLCDDSGENLFVDGHDTFDIPLIERGPTVYTRFGDAGIPFLLLVFIAGAARMRNVRKGPVR